MGSKCHAHIAPGHREFEEIRRALAADESSELRRGWRELVPFGADVAAELLRDILGENATRWHVPSREELGDVLGGQEATRETLTQSLGEIAAVLDSGCNRPI